MRWSKGETQSKISKTTTYNICRYNRKIKQRASKTGENRKIIIIIIYRIHRTHSTYVGILCFMCALIILFYFYHILACALVYVYECYETDDNQLTRQRCIHTEHTTHPSHRRLFTTHVRTYVCQRYDILCVSHCVFVKICRIRANQRMIRLLCFRFSKRQLVFREKRMQQHVAAQKINSIHIYLNGVRKLLNLRATKSFQR